MRYKRGLFVVIGITFYYCVMCLYTRNVFAMANDITEEYQDIIEDEREAYEDLEEDQEDNTEDLSDTFTDLSRFSTSSLGATRSVIVNTYDPTVDWLFDQNYFYYFYVNNDYNSQVYVFPDNYFGDRQDELINIFFEHCNSEATYYKWHYENPNNGFSATLVSRRPSNNVNPNTYYNANGYPCKNTYWEIPTSTDTPTPTPTSTVNPEDPTPTPTPTPMEDNQYKIMVVFCFGLCAGVIVGHFLTGFIK